LNYSISRLKQSKFKYFKFITVYLFIYFNQLREKILRLYHENKILKSKQNELNEERLILLQSQFEDLRQRNIDLQYKLNETSKLKIELECQLNDLKKNKDSFDSNYSEAQSIKLKDDLIIDLKTKLSRLETRLDDESKKSETTIKFLQADLETICK
jgi:hypothetical protein